MGKTISCGSIGGELCVPASKSYAHRLYICAALSSEPSHIICSNRCDDIMSTISCLSAIGAGFHGDVVAPISRNALPLSPVLSCGSSASTLRFLMPVAAALGCGAEFAVSEELSKRPIAELKAELVRHGAVFDGNKLLPSKLNRNSFTVTGDVSSQYVSGLLMALPLIGGGIVYITNNFQSSKYVDITIDCLRSAGIYVNRIGNCIEVSGEYSLSGRHVVEGDWSSAAFWLCAGAIGGCKITVNGLNVNSLQGDRQIVDILRAFGARLSFTDNSVTAYPSSLKGAVIDAAEIPDLIPVLSVVSAAAEGESRIINAQRLRYKESDRLKAIYIMLTSLRADVTELSDGLIIRGGKRLFGAKVQTFNDHRIAMSAAVASLICEGGIELDSFDCVSKSYPHFWSDYTALGGEIYEQI